MAAAHGLPISKLALHEPPYSGDDEEEQLAARAYNEQLMTLLTEGRRSDAVAVVMTMTGMPPEMVEAMRTEPWWADLEAMGPTIAYDTEIMGNSRGGAIPAEQLGAVTVPTLVLWGGASPDSMIAVGRELAAGLPHGRFHLLEGQEHVVPPEVLTPVLVEFFAA